MLGVERINLSSEGMVGPCNFSVLKVTPCFLQFLMPNEQARHICQKSRQIGD